VRNWVSAYVGWWSAFLGAIFIVTVLWAPHGIMGLARQVGERRARRAAAARRGAGAPRVAVGSGPR
jgi:hypothetical protein